MARDGFANSSNFASNAAPYTTLPFCMGAWIYPASVGITGCIIEQGDGSTNNRHRLIRDSGNTVTAATTAGGTGASATSSTTISANTWFHVLGGWAAVNSRKVWLNGGGSGTNATSLSPAAATGLSVGVNNVHNANAVAARVAELFIASVMPTDLEASLVASGINPWELWPGSIVEYWPFYGSASPEPSFAAGGHELTITGTLAKQNHAPVELYEWFTGFALGDTPAAAIPRDSMMMTGVGVRWNEPAPLHQPPQARPPLS